MVLLKMRSQHMQSHIKMHLNYMLKFSSLSFLKGALWGFIYYIHVCQSVESHENDGRI